MRLLIDSNRFIDFCAGDEGAVDTFERAALLVVPFVVLAEIRVGAQLARRGENQVRVLNELLNQPGVRTVQSTDGTAHHYAAIFSQLRRKGTRIPTNDIWIAALAIEHNLVLYTRDAHFDHIPTVARIGG
ncbi:MAG: type II toxin-antitoxin system VapC family toxin [Verrucomicrobiae bacterium]